MCEICCPCLDDDDEETEQSEPLMPEREDVGHGHPPQIYVRPEDREHKWFIESCLQQGAAVVDVIMEPHYIQPWGGEIDFNNAIYNWRVTNIKPGQQLHRKKVTENYIFWRILNLAPLKYGNAQSHKWLDFKEENRDLIIDILEGGEPCWVKFLTLPEYDQRDCLQQIVACPSSAAQCICPFWCPGDDDEMDIETHATNLRMGASRFILEDQQIEAKNAMVWRKHCDTMSCVTEFMAYISVFCATVSAFLVSAKIFTGMVNKWMMLGSGMAGTLSLALYRMSSYCRNESNEYTSQINSFIKKNRLGEYTVVAYDKNADVTQPPPT